MSINSTFLKLERQNLNVRSTTKPNLGIKQKKKKNKIFLEPSAFFDKQFLYNMDIQLILEFKTVWGNIFHYFLKILKGMFGTPCRFLK